MRIPIVPFDRGRHWTPVKLCPYGKGHACFGRVTIVVTMTRCGHKLLLQRNLVRARKVESLRVSVTLWRELSYRQKLKRFWLLENENESRKKESERVSPSCYVSIHAWYIEHICVHVQNVCNTVQSTA